MRVYLDDPAEIENKEEIKNMKPAKILTFMRAFLYKQTKTHQFERDLIAREILKLLDKITDKNDSLYPLKDDIKKEIKKFREAPLDYQKSVQDETMPFKNRDSEYLPIWTYFFIRVSNCVEDNKVVRRSFSTVIKCAFIRFFELFFDTYDECYLSRDLMIDLETIINERLPAEKDPIPYSKPETHEYDFLDFIESGKSKRMYPDDINDYRFIFRRLTPERDNNHVVICISGFTSQGIDMNEYWKGFIDLPSKPDVYSLDCKN